MPSETSASQFPFELETDDDADASEALDDLAVHVMANRALRDAQAMNASQGDVLADGGDGVGDRLVNRAPAHVMRPEDRLGVDLGRLVERDREDPAHEPLKVVVARDEIGLGIDLDDDPDLVLDRHADQTVGGDAPALFGRLGETLLAQPVDGGLDVAVRLGQRVLAIHHARAGLLAQFLDQPGGDRSHPSSLTSSRACAAKAARRFSLARARPGRLAPRLNRSNAERPDLYPAAINARACSLHLSRAMRPLNLRSASSLAASASVIAASCQ